MDSSCYFDFQAATPVPTDVVNAIYLSLKEDWGDTSSKSKYGVKAKETIDRGRKSVSKLLNCTPEDIVFTSCASEGNNTVFNSVLKYWNNYTKTTGVKGENPHFVISEIEHPSVIETVLKMENEKLITVSFLSVQQSGVVDVLSVEDHLNMYKNTVIVSVMLANNETGMINDVKSLATLIKRFNLNNRTNKKGCPILVHTDAAQAIGKMHVDVQSIGVDFLTISGKKMYGPSIGALYIKSPIKITPIYPLIYGAGQEAGLRSGAENVPMIAGLSLACDMAMQGIYRDLDHYDTLTKHFLHIMETKNPHKDVFEIQFNGEFTGGQKVTPNVVNFSLKLLDKMQIPMVDELLATDLAQKLSERGICIGKRSACYPGRPSPILSAMGVTRDCLKLTLRFSVGRETCIGDVERFVDAYWDMINDICFNTKQISYIGRIFGWNV
ncbi:hypothetical protein BB561_004229 [Smittium simulii]|uniref:Aminotransferase class V domain-containing protein n=1 Tax=Smittium simulii TaxID=133385 RepID=A0A2T9YHB6_9FUNG|nr:hypothetical protein BB561_004229 [Smittium simulii]